MSEGAPRRNVAARAWAAALDHARRGPIAYRERIVYARALAAPVELVTARAAASFGFDPPLPDPGRPGAPVTDHVHRAFVGGREAYRMRVSLDRASTARLVPEREVPERVAFFYDCLTHPEFRGQSLYPAALTSAMEALRLAGYQRAYIRVHRGNEASIAGIEKAGFRRCGRIIHAALFGFPVGPWKRPEPAPAGGPGDRP